MNETEKFLKIIFNEDESTCFSHGPKGTAVTKISKFIQDDLRMSEAQPDYILPQFFCINSLNSEKDLNVSQPYHKEDKPRRADANVESYRNILIEIDDMPVEDQLEYINDLGMPYTACTYSGSKSLHFIISLKLPFTKKFAYDTITSKIMSIVKHADKSAKNCSRFSRLPGARRNNGKSQDLLVLNDRVDNTELLEWIQDNYSEEKRFVEIIPDIATNSLNLSTKQFFADGAPDGSWNIELFKAACNATKCGYSEAWIRDSVKKINGVIDNSDISTIKSAIRRVQSDLQQKLN